MPAADVYRALWRHRWMILVLTAIAGVAAYGYTRTQPRIYQADALVRIQQRAASPGETYGSVSSLELGQRLAQTYARIAITRSIHQRVAQTLAGKVSEQDINITATPVGDVELLYISDRSEHPVAAALVANATTVALRKFITETGTLRDQMVIVDSATTPGIPVLPRTKFTVMFALMLAVLFNCALALGREFFADRLPEIDQWEARFGRPVLATVPMLNLKPPSAVLTPVPEPADSTSVVTSTETLSARSRWSIATSEGPSGSN